MTMKSIALSKSGISMMLAAVAAILSPTAKLIPQIYSGLFTLFLEIL